MRQKLFILTLFICGILLVNSSALADEGIFVTPFYGYQFGGTIKTYSGRLQIRDGENYGITIEAPYESDTTVQFTFIRHASSVIETDYYLGTTEELFDIDVDYYLLGGTKVISQGTLTSFFSGAMGVTHFSPKSSQYQSENTFALSFGLGINKDINDKVGLRIQGRLLLPIEFTGGSLYCGPNGCAAGVSGGTTLIQADITTGIIIRL